MRFTGGILPDTSHDERFKKITDKDQRVFMATMDMAKYIKFEDNHLESELKNMSLLIDNMREIAVIGCGSENDLSILSTFKRSFDRILDKIKKDVMHKNDIKSFGIGIMPYSECPVEDFKRLGLSYTYKE